MSAMKKFDRLVKGFMSHFGVNHRDASFYDREYFYGSFDFGKEECLEDLHQLMRLAYLYGQASVNGSPGVVPKEIQDILDDIKQKYKPHEHTWEPLSEEEGYLPGTNACEGCGTLDKDQEYDRDIMTTNNTYTILPPQYIKDKMEEWPIFRTDGQFNIDGKKE
jgi:hypothetical protein